MFNLQLLNSQQHLFYLVCFGFSFMVLNIDPRISFPRCLVSLVTSFLLSRFTEIIIADLAQVSEPNICGIVLHLCKNVFDSGHVLYSINIDTDIKPFFCEVVTNTQKG
jgi:hypothetical protein